MLGTQLFGSSQPTRATPLHSLIGPNSPESCQPSTNPLFESLGHLLNTSYLHGSFIKLDGLDRRPLGSSGCPNCGACQLCKCEPEMASHLLFKCRYFVRIWNMVKFWLGRHELEPPLGIPSILSMTGGMRSLGEMVLG